MVVTIRFFDGGVIGPFDMSEEDAGKLEKSRDEFRLKGTPSNSVCSFHVNGEIMCMIVPLRLVSSIDLQPDFMERPPSSGMQKITSPI